MAYKKVKDLKKNPDENKAVPYGSENRYKEYLAIALNAVRIVAKGSDGNKPELPFVVENRAKKLLLEGNAVGYSKITNKFYRVDGVGINELGLPSKLNFFTGNNVGNMMNLTAHYGKDGFNYIIYALPSDITFGEIIKEATDIMFECDVGARQNLQACRTPYIVVCQNDDLRLSYFDAIKEKQDGQAVVLVSPELGEGLKAVSINCDFLADKFREYRDAERDTLLNKLGILTANTDKKERVQGAEVYSTLGVATDYIYTLIDTFNKQMKDYDLPFEMVFNGSMEEIYEDEGKENANDESQKGEKDENSKE